MFSSCYSQVGSRSCGKTSLVQLLAQLTGNKLEVMAMNSAMDTTELLGGFEQVNHFELLNTRRFEILNLKSRLCMTHKMYLSPSNRKEAFSRKSVWLIIFPASSFCAIHISVPKTKKLVCFVTVCVGELSMISK